MNSNMRTMGGIGLPVQDDGWIGPALFIMLVVVIGVAIAASYLHGFYNGRVAAQLEMRQGGVK